MIKKYTAADDYLKIKTGKEYIDKMFNEQASILQQEERATTKLFFLKEDGYERFVGFCTSLVDRISKSAGPIIPDGDFPSYFPCMYVYAIGVDEEYQRQGIGSIIIDWLIDLSYEIKEDVGLTFIVLQAEESLFHFYIEDKKFTKWHYLMDDQENGLHPLIFDLRNISDRNLAGII